MSVRGGGGGTETSSLIEREVGDANAKPSSTKNTNDKDKISSQPESIVTSDKPLSPWQQVRNRLYRWRRAFRRRAGEAVTAAGFLASSATALVSRKNKGQWQRLQPTVDALRKFLRESQIMHVQQFSSSSFWSFRWVENLVILCRFQKEMHRGAPSLPEQASLDDDEVTASRQSTQLQQEQQEQQSQSSDALYVPSVEQALRYVKFATAAYGDAMIRAAQLDLTGEYNVPLSFSADTTLDRVSEHVGVPPSDIVLLDIDYDGSDLHLRHFVAVNHAHEEIVLSIRGTYNLADLVVDAAGFTAPFGIVTGDEQGGQAHAEMAKQAAAIWRAAGPTVMEFWNEHPEYTLILTGHSLGAGTACLLHLLLCEMQQHKPQHEQDDLCIVPSQRLIRCVAFAAPPVYYNSNPSLALRRAMGHCVNFVHGDDMVPFLSVDAIRHFLAQLQLVAEQMEQVSYSHRLRLFWGYQHANIIEPHWIETLQCLPRPKPLEGAPCLYVPAAVNLWLTPLRRGILREDDYEEYDPTVYFQAHRCSSIKLATTVGLQVHANMLHDHFPPRYVHALHHFHPDAQF